MKVNTPLPIASLYFRHWDSQDSEVGIVVAKAVFKRHADGRFRANGDMPALVLEDVYEGEANASPLLHEQEIAPGKRGSDLIVHATARSPEGRAMADWAVSVAIPDRLSYGFQVRGPCEWRRGLTGWKPTQPELVNEVAITYALAFGGASPTGDEQEPWEFFENNPVGIGYAGAARLQGRESFAAPQIGALADFIAADPGAEMSVHGFGPIAKPWLPRRGHAGTFDEDWEIARHPRMPLDYTNQFWNAAPVQMQLEHPLTGGEVITLTGVSHAKAPVELALPGVGLVLQLSGEGGEEQLAMVLDTVEADVNDPDPAAHSLILVWRARIDRPEWYQSCTIDSIRLSIPDPESEDT